MNSGIHDAHAAAEAICYALAGGDPDRAVATYARVRRDAAALDVQQNTQKNYEEMRQTDAGRRSERFREMVEIAADPDRARAYLRVASMLASFETSCRRMRRGLTPVTGPAPRPAGQLMSDALREWTLPGTPEGLLTAAVLPPVAAGTDDLVAAVSSSSLPIVAALPRHGDVAELVGRCERAGVAAVEVAGPAAVAAAVAARRDALVVAAVDASDADIESLSGQVTALVAAGADVVALAGTSDTGLVGKIHLGEKAVPLAVTGQSLPDRLTLSLAGVGLVLDRDALAAHPG